MKLILLLGALALSGAAVSSCSAGPQSATGKPCSHCVRVPGNNANARVAFEQARWACREGGKYSDCGDMKAKECLSCVVMTK